MLQNANFRGQCQPTEWPSVPILCANFAFKVKQRKSTINILIYYTVFGLPYLLESCNVFVRRGSHVYICVHFTRRCSEPPVQNMAKQHKAEYSKQTKGTSGMKAAAAAGIFYYRSKLSTNVGKGLANAV